MTNLSGPWACSNWLARSRPPILAPYMSDRSTGHGAAGSHNSRSLASLHWTREGWIESNLHRMSLFVPETIHVSIYTDVSFSLSVFLCLCLSFAVCLSVCLSVYVRLSLSLAISSCASEYANLDYPNLNYPHNCNFDYLNTIEYYWILLTLFLSVPNCRLSLPLSFQIISFLKYGQLTCCKLVQRHFWCAGWCLF